MTPIVMKPLLLYQYRHLYFAYASIVLYRKAEEVLVVVNALSALRASAKSSITCSLINSEYRMQILSFPQESTQLRQGIQPRLSCSCNGFQGKECNSWAVTEFHAW